MPQSSERQDGWYSIADGDLPSHGEIVGVHGGVAQYRNGNFYTGMEDPRWERSIQWAVTHWVRLTPPGDGHDAGCGLNHGRQSCTCSLYLNPTNEREPKPARAELPACAAIRSAHGFIFAGKRHGECFASYLASGYDKRYAAQGFMTNKGRFVDRIEAFQLMQDAGVKSADPGGYRGTQLYSEDLY